jgi:anaerobic selenocysteine-containing dehydrogenase
VSGSGGGAAATAAQAVDGPPSGPPPAAPSEGEAAKAAAEASAAESEEATQAKDAEAQEAQAEAEAEAGGDGDRASGGEGPERPGLIPFVAPTPTQVSGKDAYSLRLVAARRLYDQGTLVQRSPSLAHLAGGARLRLNTFDFDRLGISDGERVRVSSSHTAVVVEAVRDDGVPRGSASLAFNQPGVAAAELIDSARPVTDVRVETL